MPCRASTDIYPFFLLLLVGASCPSHLQHCAVGYPKSSKRTVRESGPHAVVPDAPAEHLANCFPECWDEQDEQPPTGFPSSTLSLVDLGPVGLAHALQQQRHVHTATALLMPPLDAMSSPAGGC